MAPVRAIAAARRRGPDRAPEEIDTTRWTLDAAGRVVPDVRPAPKRRFAKIEVDLEVGHTTVEEVPEPICQAMRMLVAHWTSIVSPHRLRPVQDGSARLLAPYCTARL